MGLVGIVSMVKRQVPHMVDEVDGISQWALVQGGAGSMHIDWLAKQHELHIPGRRKLKGELWMSIAVDIPPRLVKVSRALTYMAFSCPKGCMEGNYCIWLHPTDLKSLVKTDEWKAGSREVEAKLDVFLTALNTSPEYKDVPPAVRIDVDGRCENRLARLLCKKRVGGLKSYMAVDEVIDDALAELQALIYFVREVFSLC